MSINRTIQDKEDKTSTLTIKDGSETNILITKEKKKKEKRKERRKEVQQA